MGIDWSAIEAAGGIGKGTPRKIAAREKRLKKRGEVDSAYAVVDARDKLISKVSGLQLRKGGGEKIRIERHHMARRSVAKSRIGDPHNIISVSAYEAEYLDSHALIPVNAMGDEVTDIREITGFAWNRAFFGKGKEPRDIKIVVTFELRAR